MITIIVHNLYTGSHHTFDIIRVYDYHQMALYFGPGIHQAVGGTSDIRVAADRVADYLSNHHMQAEIVDPERHTEIYNPNVEKFSHSGVKPNKAIDLKDVLESYNQADNLDIPEMHVFNAATHRWGK